MSAIDQTGAAPAHPGYGSKTYRAYVLGALLVVYTCNFIDRILIGVLQESIRVDLGITQNLYLGILGGPAFAILYTLLGIPIARWAERANRISIVALGTAVWSAMTAACGLALNYWQLLIARIGVGIGEAACTPPAHSAISDYFPANRRATALGIYALGIPIGTSLAALGGGWLNQHFDWRTAFLLLGAPGLVIALLLKLTVREPARSGAATEAPRFGPTVAFLSRKASFWHIAIGGALMSFVGYGAAQFLPSHMVRNYELGPTLAVEVARAAYAFAAIGGLAVGLGTFLGGFLSDRLAERHKNVLAWLPALGVAFAAPLYLASFAQAEFAPAFALLLVAPIFHYLYLGPMFAVTQAVAEPRMRATAAAVLLLVVNLIGYGLGPPFVGLANDFFAARILAEQGLSAAQCAAGSDPGACAGADATGLKYALGAALFFMLWAGVHFLLAGRTLARDRVG